MPSGWVALVALKAVASVQCGVGAHEAVAGGFCKDRRGLYLGMCAVAADHRVRRNRQRRREPAVYQRRAERRRTMRLRSARERTIGALHREERRVMDVQPVDLGRPAPADPECVVLPDQTLDLGALRGGELLRVAQLRQRCCVKKRHGGGGHRTGDRASTGLIDSAEIRHTRGIPGNRAAEQASRACARRASIYPAQACRRTDRARQSRSLA